jgi:hypothetical protein
MQPTIIDLLNQSVDKYADNPFLWEKGDKGYQPAGLPALNSAVQPEAMINAPMNSSIAGVTVKEAMF